MPWQLLWDPVMHDDLTAEIVTGGPLPWNSWTGPCVWVFPPRQKWQNPGSDANTENSSCLLTSSRPPSVPIPSFLSSLPLPRSHKSIITTLASSNHSRLDLRSSLYYCAFIVLDTPPRDFFIIAQTWPTLTCPRTLPSRRRSVLVEQQDAQTNADSVLGH